MQARTLNEWLALLEKRHPLAIDLGLSRVSEVAWRLQLQSFSCPVITVAGTNGKGSTVAVLEQLARQHGLHVGVYTSPHLLQFNERIRINGADIDDAQLCAAFTEIEKVCAGISLSYFEFTTLAALWLFQRAPLQLLVLEVGLGGRLDAVNIVDADVAVITTIDFDHMSFLGNTLEKIAHEKAGICRPGRPVVIADETRAELIMAAAHGFGAVSFAPQHNFRWHSTAQAFHWQCQVLEHERILHCAVPVLDADVVAAALQAFVLAMPSVWSNESVVAALAHAALPGRWQQIRAQPRVILDVGHNPQAAHRLAQRAARECHGQLRLVTGMLADKDQHSSLAAFTTLALGSAQQNMPPQYSQPHWYLCGLPGVRGCSAETLRDALPKGQLAVQLFDDVSSAWHTALDDARPDDVILVWGSFLTVAAVLAADTTSSENGK